MKTVEMLIIGSGPAGLSAAIEAAKVGVRPLIVDANPKVGGQLFKQIHKFFGSSMHRAGTRGMNIGKIFLEQCNELGVEIWQDCLAMGYYEGNVVAVDRRLEDGTHKLFEIQAKTIVIATGASENSVRFPGWTLPGVMGAGAAQTMINYNRVLPGKKVLMIGSGNVGLIVSYQLMQAGAEIVGIVEALPKINGYAVHAAKLAREGVPIYTGYTVVQATAEKERVNKAIIGKVNPDWSIVPGSEIALDVDTICMGAGMKPLSGFAHMAGCAFTFDRFLGGRAPVHNKKMETTVSGIYVAGDSTGIEEANTAIEEGKIAGTAIAERLGYLDPKDADAACTAAWERLAGLRQGHNGDIRTRAKEGQIAKYREIMEGGN